MCAQCEGPDRDELPAAERWKIEARPEFVASLKLTIRKYHIMIRNISKLISFAPDGDAVPIINVDGGALCSICQIEYREHPEIHATFHMTCKGDVVKT